MLPNRTNGILQPKITSSPPIARLVSEPESLEPECVTPCAKPLSEAGSQREKARVAAGKAPASPTPNQNRIAMSDVAFHAAALNIVKADHQRTIPVSIRRGPMRSASHPAGTCSRLYPK